ncbi:MAG: RNA-protein complex protein Nop10 [Candidatus Nanohaloarchaea archaeon]|nr:RNA-protein complex protein Nop10 [Candidatus Nanohaloarchaea archaeon]
MGKIKKCRNCNTYTLGGECPGCGSEAGEAGPPKFSLPDSYGEYRREMKRRERDDQG